MFIGSTLGQDPHTLGLYKAGQIAKYLDIPYYILAPMLPIKEKVGAMVEEDPSYIGLSYRLSPKRAVNELREFLVEMEKQGLFKNKQRKIAFSGLPDSVEAVKKSKLAEKYPIVLHPSKKNLQENVRTTLEFFDIPEDDKMGVLKKIVSQNEPKKIEILDELAKHVVHDDSEVELQKPSDKALRHLPSRIVERGSPIIRTHYGVPAKSIEPTVKGIKKIAEERLIDEISLGSSDLSQRYFDNEEMFNKLNNKGKNDGGVPYKTKDDLIRLFEATRRGNYPSIKPYAHVYKIKEFVDVCLESGMLYGAHQAIPLFWFSELDGRGPLTVPEAIVEHIEAVKHLAQKGIPVEMNDPNQWSSRFVHDTLFVVDYALIASVMYEAGVKDIILQCQFNKPADTGDYADLAKMSAAIEIVELLRPRHNQSNIIVETRAGIEHFSTDLQHAKYQLARTTLLQQMINPQIIHLVSYCEANYVAQAKDIIESAKVVHRAIKAFKQHEHYLKQYLKDPIVTNRKNHLINEAMYVLKHIVQQSKHYRKEIQPNEYYKCLSDPQALIFSMKSRLMTAPGVVHPDYKNDNIFTKANQYGFIDSYESWDSKTPINEMKRLSLYFK